MKKLLLVFLLAFGYNAVAQQDILLTQYMYNKLAINPAYAGSQDIFSMDMIGRLQWVGVDGAPKTISLTAHTPLRNRHVALGLNVYRDQLGPYSDYTATGIFAYRIIFRTTKLCFGISGGVKYAGIDWSALNPKEKSDFDLSNTPTSKAVPDIDAGIYYYGPQFYVGVSSRHLIQSQMFNTNNLELNSQSYNYTKLLRHFFGMAGGAFPLTTNLMIMPSVLVKYVQNAPIQADMNINFLFDEILTLGVSYRTENAIAMILGINITRNLSIGYSYDIWLNSLRTFDKGSHEIRLGLGFDIFSHDRMLTPRYF